MTFEQEIKQKAAEWSAAMIDSIRAHRAETAAQLERRQARQKVLKIEEEMSTLKQDAMRENIHTALAKPVIHASILALSDNQ